MKRRQPSAPLLSVSPAGAGHSRRAERVKNSCRRCASAPWGSAWRRAHKATRTGRGGSGSGSSSLGELRLEARADAEAANAKVSEHSSSWLGGTPVVKEPRDARQVSPQTRLPAARRAKPLPRPAPKERLPTLPENDSDSAAGQMVYDARWLHCVVSAPHGLSSTAAGQRASRPGSGSGPLKAAGCKSWLGPPQ